MKIEFLDDECTEARLTVGWLRKRVAFVVSLSTSLMDENGSYSYWRHRESRRIVLRACSIEIEAERVFQLRLRAADTDWQPLRSLPKAKVIK